MTCGPPPKDLNFNTISTAEWTLNGTKILEDNEHHFGTANGAATLTVEHFFITDVGKYGAVKKLFLFLSQETLKIIHIYNASAA